MRTRLFTAAILLLSGPLQGQSLNSGIRGAIQDQASASIPGVTVTAKNIDTGVATKMLTGEAGMYSFPRLTPGKYELTAELPGFKTETRNVELGQGQQLDVNILLKVKGPEEPMT